jgi:ATP-dependent DNA helicase RecG
LKNEDLIQLIKQGESETLEFKESFSKAVIETIVAFSNTSGGKLIIGINAHQKIVGVSITEETIQKWINEIKQATSPQVIPDVSIIELDSCKLVVIEVIEYPVKPVSFKNKFFKRVANSNHLLNISEIANEHLKTINSSWDYYPDPNHSLSQISTEKIQKYIYNYEKWNDTIVNFKPIDFLNKQEILKDNKLTFGAYLLFAKDLCIISDIQIGRFKSDSKIIDSLSLSTDLFTEVEEILTFIKKHLMVEFIITGSPQREERFDYPPEAIREIVLNMIIHRDYRSSNGSTIKIFDDRIEFYNPGGLFDNLTIEELLIFKHKSKTRNKLIANAFKAIGHIEKYGSGIMRIFNICDHYGIKAPSFIDHKDGFEVILSKEKRIEKGRFANGELSGELSGELNGELNEKQKLIFNKIKNEPGINANQLSKLLNIPFSTMDKNIRQLIKYNLIVRKGSKKTGGYFIKEK